MDATTGVLRVVQLVDKTDPSKADLKADQWADQTVLVTAALTAALTADQKAPE